MNTNTNPERSALVRSEDTPPYTVSHPALTGRDLILNPGNLSAMMQVAKMMSLSKQSVPKHLRGNEGGCLAVTMQAMRWNMDPFALALKTYTADPEGPIAYEGQAIIAALNNSPLLADRLSFTWFGNWEKIVGKFRQVESKTKKDNDGNFKKYIVPAWDFDKDEEGLGVTVSATLVGEKEPRKLTVLMKQCRTRNSPLWTEDPQQQIGYRSAGRWGRLHAPDVIMGVYSPDELDTFEAPKNMGEADVITTVPPELLARANEAAGKGVAAYQQFWKDCTNLERAQLNELSDEHERLKEAAVAADKKRTVENTTKGTPKATPAPTPAPTAAPTAASQADPDTGELSGADAGGQFEPSYAKVVDLMLKAKDRIGVEVAAEWIQDCPPEQHAELNAKRDELLARFPQ